MGKLAKLVVSGTMAFAIFGGVASAQTPGCTINGTGPGSVNSCTFTVNNDLDVDCTNNATITVLNAQIAASGDSVVDSNTTAGGAASGSASNTNTLAASIAAACAAAAPAPTTPTPTPPAGGMGGGQVAAAPATAAAPAPVAVKALPNTGENDLAIQAGIGALAFASIAGIAHVVVAAYRRSSLGQL